MYITYKARTESPSRNMTDSITHVSEREREKPLPMLSLSVPVICVPVHLCGCLRPRARSSSTWTAASVPCECTQTCMRERRGEERRRRRRRRPHRYGVANGEIQPATETVIPSPYCSLSSLLFHQERLCFSISDSSPRLLYLEFIWCGSSGA